MRNRITDFFDNMAKDRNMSIAENLIVEYEQKKRSQRVISLIDPQPEELILDIGCGNARDFIPVLTKESKITGVDLSPRMIEEARRELKNYDGFELEVGDATNLRFPNSYFDKVLASEIIEHIPDWEKAISEMMRVLKPGGYLVVSTPNRKSWYGFDRFLYENILLKQWEHPYDQWKTYNELEKALTGCGFKVASYHGMCYMPGFIIPYFVLPRFLKRVLICCVEKVEEKFSALFPAHGYLLCVKAIKE